jgi:hypothetical protein
MCGWLVFIEMPSRTRRSPIAPRPIFNCWRHSQGWGLSPLWTTSVNDAGANERDNPGTPVRQLDSRPFPHSNIFWRAPYQPHSLYITEEHSSFLARHEGPNALQWQISLDSIGKGVVVRLNHPDEITGVPKPDFKEEPGRLFRH